MTQLTTPNGAPASNLTFGTMQFGGRADASQSRAMFEDARAAGINHFDSAYVYTAGSSETLLGQMVQDQRNDLIIATKAAYKGGSGADNIRKHFNISQDRLQLDTIDLFYLHRFDDNTPLEDTFEALSALQQSGKIRYIGVSNFAAWQVMKAQSVAATLGTCIDVVQPMYSLVKRQVEVEIMPLCVDQGIAIAPYSPLGGGLLTGKYARGETGRLTEDEGYASRYGQAWMHEAAVTFSDFANDLGVDSATLAVAWVAAHPSAPLPIVSGRSAAQLAPSLLAESFEMTPELYNQIKAITPTPAPATDRTEEA